MAEQRSSFERVLERFGDLRGYMYFCLLGSALLERGLIDAAPEAFEAAQVRYNGGQ
jgi:hypothetical protein